MASNTEGPKILWNKLKGKKVKSNDGKDVGEIKEISLNHLRIQKGKISKDKFWIPKYLGDAFDGKTLWLLVSEEEVVGKYLRGTEPPADQYTKDFEAFRKTPYGQKADYQSDFDQNIRLVEDYKNIRDLK
jgi:hypothetical protein